MAKDVVLKSYVTQALDGIQKGAKQGSIEVAIKIASQAKSLANFEKGFQTGQLKASYMWKSDQGSGLNTGGAELETRPTGDRVLVGTGVEHGTYIEFGTRKMPAQPTLRPAADIVVNGVDGIQAVAKAIVNSVKQEVPK